jgi:hypothetical protein
MEHVPQDLVHRSHTTKRQGTMSNLDQRRGTRQRNTCSSISAVIRTTTKGTYEKPRKKIASSRLDALDIQRCICRLVRQVNEFYG